MSTLATPTTIRPVACKGDLVEVVELVLADETLRTAGVAAMSAFLVKRGEEGLELAKATADSQFTSPAAASVWSDAWMETFMTLAASGR